MTSPPPRLAEAWDYLEQIAEQQLARREAGYPGMIEKGALTAFEAERGLRIMRAIVADWRFATSREGEPGTEATNYEKRIVLRQLAESMRAWADAAPADALRQDTAEAIETLLWHQNRRFGPVWCTEATIAAQAAVAAVDRMERKAA